jgi:hypothetical protein
MFPLTAQVAWPVVPPPFDRIVEACMRRAPEQRPSPERGARYGGRNQMLMRRWTEV